MKKKLFLFTFLIISLLVSAQELSYPHGSFEMQFELSNRTLVYGLEFNSKTVIKRSKLGLELKYTESLLNASVAESYGQC